MNTLNEYIVSIQGIKNGLHQFDYDVNKDFLAHFDYKDLLDAHIHAHVNMFKNNRIFDIEIHITGDVLSECDRCTDELSIPIDFTYHLVIKLEDGFSDDDIIFIPESSTEINLAPYVYEALVFSIPMRRVHADDEEGNSLCNEDMIRRLKEYLVQDTPTDPRWDALKRLLN